MLALVAERAAGTRFEQLVENWSASPAGLTNTGFLRSDELPSGVAVGYLTPDGMRTNVFHLPVLGSGDGGIFSTAADIHRFWTALFDGRIVSSEHVALMTSPHSEAPAHKRPLRARVLARCRRTVRQPGGLRRRRLVPVRP